MISVIKLSRFRYRCQFYKINDSGNILKKSQLQHGTTLG
jgi:hypothetical protein